MEKFKKINGFHNYMISNYGNILSLNYRGTKKSKLLKSYFSGSYYFIRLPGRKRFYIHRLVLEHFKGKNPKDKPFCNHKDGNKLNNHINNLEWTSKSENGKHAIKTGLCINPIGENGRNAKLKNGEVWLIKKLLASKKFTQTFIAKMFNIHTSCISNIKRNKLWNHIEYE